MDSSSGSFLGPFFFPFPPFRLAPLWEILDLPLDSDGSINDRSLPLQNLNRPRNPVVDPGFPGKVRGACPKSGENEPIIR